MPPRSVRRRVRSSVESDARKAKRLGFRSGGEMSIAAFLTARGMKFLYEEKSLQIKYTVPESTHNYLPDFFLKKKDGTVMYIDFKGRWEKEDREKHLYIQQQHPSLDIRIIFERDPARQFIGKRGTSSSYADICTKGKGRGKWREFSLPFAHVLRQRGVEPVWVPTAWLKECETISGVQN